VPVVVSAPRRSRARCAQRVRVLCPTCPCAQQVPRCAQRVRVCPCVSVCVGAWVRAGAGASLNFSHARGFIVHALMHAHTYACTHMHTHHTHTHTHTHTNTHTMQAAEQRKATVSRASRRSWAAHLSLSLRPPPDDRGRARSV
jgi:hypothetical protein